MINIKSASAKIMFKQNILSKNFSMWGHLKPRPADPILGIVDLFKKDTSSSKVNLSAGTYKCNEGKPYILNCVKEAQNIIVKKQFDHEYLPIEGSATFNKNAIKLAYGPDNKAFQEERIVSCQSLSGTGALRLGMEFLKEHYTGPKKVLVPNPSWPNHKNIVNRSHLSFSEYRYYDFDKKGLNIEAMLEDLDKAERGTIVVLHVCAHNPTGMDPTKSEWDSILKVVQDRGLFPFFDMAYQGFSTGDLVKDSYSLRKFADPSAIVACGACGVTPCLLHNSEDLPYLSKSPNSFNSSKFI